ncbi:hypothetical protein [Staphylococcus haemolyticus]|uniref:hypothetical protein n=1 Tax=Staphylococcus haemolyticus TaxID=1283 RepID=UPI000AADC76A|nr:hypothetical protein [Staphylococcus haemolyticus]QXN77262.1 hypothetical protein KVY09_09010 [Staphylococcus haemolyticus]
MNDINNYLSESLRLKFTRYLYECISLGRQSSSDFKIIIYTDKFIFLFMIYEAIPIVVIN